MQQHAPQVRRLGRGAGVLGRIHAGIHGGEGDGPLQRFVGQKLPVVEVGAAAEQQRHGAAFE